ncbi:MAG: hypothetical protein JO000_16395 [Alphaproteobacteria bacterium]|nr:hypothetical protein [Alphaproteobacteria bacterium]
MTAEDADAVEEGAAPDALESTVGQAIAACDGDLRAAIRALVVANNFLTEQNTALAQELDFAWRWISPGFTRSKLKRRMSSGEPD